MLADVVPERAESLKQHFDLPEAASDWQEAVSRADVVGRYFIYPMTLRSIAEGTVAVRRSHHESKPYSRAMTRCAERSGKS